MTAWRHSIRIKILAFSVVVNLLLISCFTAYLYYVEKKSLEEKIQIQLLTTAKTLKRSVDEYHSRIQNESSITPQEYNETLHRQSGLAKELGVEYIYTLILDKEGKARFASDSYTDEDLKNGKITSFYKLYEDAPQAVFSAFKSGVAATEQYSDSFGSHMSLFLPAFVDGDPNKKYVIGVDLSMDDVSERLNAIVIDSAWYTLAAIFMAMLVSYAMYTPMLNSIVKLSNLAREVANGNLSARSPIKRKDEIGDLSDSVNTMIGSLGELIENMESNVQKRTENLNAAMHEIVSLHKSVQDSISYASMIQSALIPTFDVLKPYFSDCFSIWQPKDVVGGDIYMFESFVDRDACLIFSIDCTGHGVPGAFVTMLVKAVERNIVAHIAGHPNKEVSPAYILSIFNKSIKHMLKQDEKNSFSNAGFDGTVFYYNKKEKKVKFASAQNHVLMIRDGKTSWIKGDKQSVGYKTSNPDFEFKEHVIEVLDGDTFFISTDGLYDQNGGAKDIPFGRKRIETIFTENIEEPLNEIKELILYELGSYQGRNERNDDISFIGLKI